MIPKIIHFVWVGDAEKSPLINRCIESWRRFLPEYQIIEWDNDKLLALNNPYALEAYAHKKWAFVSDYLRLYALYHFGGFYFDSDLELTQSVEKFRDLQFVTGFEQFNGRYAPVTALMGAEKHNRIIGDLLKDYDGAAFVNQGALNLETSTIKISRYLKSKFNMHSPYNGQCELRLSPYEIIYPSYFFCTPQPGKPHYAIHHFNGSWAEDFARKTIFRVNSHSIVVLKRKFSTGKPLPLMGYEKLIFLLKLTDRYSVAVIQTLSSPVIV